MIQPPEPPEPPPVPVEAYVDAGGHPVDHLTEASYSCEVDRTWHCLACHTKHLNPDPAPAE